MKKNKLLSVLLALAGLVILLAGIFVFTTPETKLTSGLCFGVGACALSLGSGWFISSFLIQADKEEAILKQKTIEENDERNIRIRERAGYMVARAMNYVLSIFILVLAFIGADRMIIYMVAGIIFLEFVLVVYFSNRYSKTM
jgi:hypothetical protein